MTSKIILGAIGLAIIVVAALVAPDIKRYIKISTM
jgi:hypothetical protein